MIWVFWTTRAPFWATIVVGAASVRFAEVPVAGEDRVGAGREAGFERADRSVGDRFEFRERDLAYDPVAGVLFDERVADEFDVHVFALQQEHEIRERRAAV